MHAINILKKYTAFLHQTLLAIVRKIEDSRGWAVYTSLFATALVFLFTFPQYDLIEPGNWDVVFNKGAHLLRNGNYPAASHEAKLTFRLVFPLILRLTHLNITGAIIVLGVIGVLNFYLVINITWKTLRNKRTAMITGLCTALIYFGKFPFVNLVATFFDAACLLFILLAFNTRSGLLRALLIFLSAFTDERGLFASFLLLAFTFVDAPQRSPLAKLFSPSALFIYAGWAAYAGTRIFLIRHFGLSTDTGAVGLEVLLGQLSNVLPGMWLALEGLWIPVGLAIILLARDKRFFDLLACSLAVIAVGVAALMVYDVSRSMLYLFPIIFVAFRVIRDYPQCEKLQTYLSYALLLCLLCPPYSVGGIKGGLWKL